MSNNTIMEHHSAIVRLTLQREGPAEMDRFCDANNIERCLCPAGCGYAPWTGTACMLCGIPVAHKAPPLVRTVTKQPPANDPDAKVWNLSHWDGQSRLPCFGSTIARAATRLNHITFTETENDFLAAAHAANKTYYAAALDDIKCRYATAMLELERDEDAAVFIAKAKAAFGDTKGHWQTIAKRIQRERER